MTARRRTPGRRESRPTSTDRLISQTRWRLALVTMTLLAALIVAVGATTAFLALRSLDDSVDHALDSAATAATERLTDADSVSSGSGAGESEADATPSPGASPSGESEDVSGGDHDFDHEPQSADTFFLYLDEAGAVVANPSNVTLSGLPDQASVAVAASEGRDLRTVVAGTVPVRLLTVKIGDEAAAAAPGGGTVAYVQAGFVLTLRDEQAGTLLRTIVIVGLVGLAGAAVLTFVITGRALVPIRSTFARERRFVATSSHELRTPIAVIRSTVELLDREGLVQPAGTPFVADILAETDRLGRLVTDLAALAAAQAGPPEQPTPVDLRILVADAARRIGPLAAERGVTIEPPNAGPPVRVLGLSDALVQVAVILIDNAIKATPQGGRVELAVVRRGGFGELSVDDQGAGVPDEHRDRIFEPFARLSAGREDDGGSGLGLTIARALVERLNGSISVGQTGSGGARFVVSVPLA